MSLLEVRAIDAQYGLLNAVRGATLTIEEGETRALVGANGAGKTTLLRTIAGAHRPVAGSIIFDGADITNVPAYRRVSLGIALVPEGRRLFPGLSVEENLSVAGGKRRAATGPSIECSMCSRCCASGAGSAPRRCPVASSRQPPSAARSCATRASSFSTRCRWGCPPSR